MELELGLALPPLHVAPIRKLDLNLSSFETTKEKKRNFAEAFDDSECISKKTPSLLVWDGQPNDGDDGRQQRRTSFDAVGNRKEEEGYEIVGWPPIKSWRKKLLHPRQINYIQGCGGNIVNGRGSGAYINGVIRNSSFVKVKMEGVAIGRKIDLMLFNSYQALITTLLNMFSRYRENDKMKDGPCSFIFSYLDKEGDWLLAGDVPWQIFIETVQRIEISKQSS